VAIDEAVAKAGSKVVPLDDSFRDKWENAKTDREYYCVGWDVD